MDDNFARGYLLGLVLGAAIGAVYVAPLLRDLRERQRRDMRSAVIDGLAAQRAADEFRNSHAPLPEV